MGRQLGCTILVEPFFWPRELWIPVPSDWSKNIVTGKGYSVETAIGADLWNEVCTRRSGAAPAGRFAVSEGTGDRFGAPITVFPRLGQGAFRVEVIDAYSRRCAITGEKTLPALEAATFGLTPRKALTRFATGFSCVQICTIFSIRVIHGDTRLSGRGKPPNSRGV